jgi:urease accessory protein
MQARASIVADVDSRGLTRLVELREAAPLAMRWTRDAVFLVSTAQGLLGEDTVELNVSVRPGATLRIRSAAATLAYASSNARFLITADVASGGFLDWEPEPLIATRHCRLSLQSNVTLSGDARLRWTENCLLGRFQEEPGDLSASIFVDYDCRPLLRHQLTIGNDAPAWDGPAGLGGTRAVGYRLIVDRDQAAATHVGAGWAAMALDERATVISALAKDHQSLCSKLQCAEQSLIAHDQGLEVALAQT